MAQHPYQATAWDGQFVAMRPPSGGVYLLATAQKHGCTICRYGVRIDTVWVAAAGDAHRLTWCRSCFNADWLPVPQSGPDPTRAPAEAIDFNALPHYWPGARQAIEDLESRGLL